MTVTQPQQALPKSNHAFWLAATLLLVCLTSLNVAHALPTLDKPIDVFAGGQKITFLRDSDERTQFYYLPPRPKIATRTIDGKLIPNFFFAKYSFEKDRQGNELRGGAIDMTVEFDLSETALAEAKQKIAQQTGLEPGRIKATMIPVSSARIDVYGHGADGAFITRSLGSGPSLVSPGSHIPISIDLTPEGSAFYEPMLEGKAAVGINFTYSYSALTPAIHLIVRGSWDKIYSHYSSSVDAVAKVRAWYAAGSFKGRWDRLRDDLTDNTGFEIDWKIRPTGGTGEEFKKLVQWIEESVYMTIFSAVFDVTPPKSGDPPADAQAGNEDGFFGGLNVALAVKDLRRRKTGSITFTLKGNLLVEVPSGRNGNHLSVVPRDEREKQFMYRIVKDDTFFNFLKIVFNASINPTEYRTTGVKFRVRRSDGLVEDKAFIPDRRGQRLVDIDDQESNRAILSFRNADGNEFKFSYQMEMDVQQDLDIDTIKSRVVELPGAGRQVVEIRTKDIGIDFVRIEPKYLLFSDTDFSDLEHAGATVDKANLPKFISFTVTQAGKRLSGIIDSKSVFKGGGRIIWPVRPEEGGAIRIQMTAQGYLTAPRTRRLVWESADDLRNAVGGLVVAPTNDDFR